MTLQHRDSADREAPEPTSMHVQKPLRWIITRDFTFRKDNDDVSAVGIGHDVDGMLTWKSKDSRKEIVAAMRTEFRLLDGDRHVYFHGRTSDIDECGDLALAPLDWASPRYGCAEMQHRPAGSQPKWEIL